MAEQILGTQLGDHVTDKDPNSVLGFRKGVAILHATGRLEEPIEGYGEAVNQDSIGKALGLIVDRQLDSLPDAYAVVSCAAPVLSDSILRELAEQALMPRDIPEQTPRD